MRALRSKRSTTILCRTLRYLSQSQEDSSNVPPKWARNMEALREQLSQHGKPQDSKLQDFLDRNRHQYQRKNRGEEYNLSSEQIKQLEEIGQLISLQPLTDKWNHKFHAVQDFVEKHGKFPCDLPQEELDEHGKVLSRWCIKQKALYRNHHRLQEINPDHGDKIDRLNRIGFCWNAKERKWKTKYRELIDYRRNHGDCLVPTTYHNQSLAVWVGEQRYHYNKHMRGIASSMTEERIYLLEELDFCWNALDERWLRRYEELSEFVRIQGQGHLPLIKQNRPLRRWCNHQLSERRKLETGETSTMTKDRIAMLDKLGFPWV